MSLNWRGEEIKNKLLEAQKRGVDKTMAECVVQAKSNHPGWHNRTGTAEGSVRIQQFAQPSGSGARGLWGSSAVNYVIWLELKHGSFLRRTADIKYPSLAGFIREAFAR